MGIFSSMKAAFRAAPSLTLEEARSRLASGKAVLVDVREPGEWAMGVVKSAELLPLSDLTGPRKEWKRVLANLGDRDLLLYCASGARSRMAANLLGDEGINAFNLGGISDLTTAGFQTRTPGSR